MMRQKVMSAKSLQTDAVHRRPREDVGERTKCSDQGCQRSASSNCLMAKLLKVARFTFLSLCLS